MRSLSLLLAALVASSSAFSVTQPPLRAMRAQRTSSVPPAAISIAPLRPKHGVSRLASVQMGLFGLGGPEIAVIAVVTLFLVGPEKILSLAKEAGKAVPELKEVSAEALEGFKEASVETAKDLKDKSGPALQELKAAATPALQELKEAATPVLSDLKDVALKEVKEVAAAVKEGADEAEAPAAIASASDTEASAKKAA